MGIAMLPIVSTGARIADDLLRIKPVVDVVAGSIAALSGIIFASYIGRGVGAVVSGTRSAIGAMRGLRAETLTLDKVTEQNKALQMQNSALSKDASLYRVTETGTLKRYTGAIDGVNAQQKIANGELLNYKDALTAQTGILTDRNVLLKDQAASLLGVAETTAVATGETEGFSISATVAAARSGVATVATDAWAASTGLLTTAMDMVPGLILLTAIGVGLSELMQHWKAVWGAIKAVTSDVWSFIKQHWTDALFMTPLGPIIEIITHLK